MAFVVFSDSYVARLEEYVKRNPSELADAAVQYYAKSGMSTTNKMEQELRRLLNTPPKYLVLNLGGNDVNSSCHPQQIFDRIAAIVQRLKEAGVEEEFVASIVERGRFKAYTGCDSTMFNKVRLSVNEKLSAAFRGHYIDVGKKLKYPRDYDWDLIHPGWTEGVYGN